MYELDQFEGRVARMSSEVVPVMAELGDAVRRYQAAVDDFDREVARLMGINETDLRCLEILLEEVPEASPSRLAARLGLTTGSMTAVLDRLERLGYLVRSPHPTDRRVTLVEPTASGQELCGGPLPEGITAVAEVFQALSEADQHELLRLIQHLTQEVGKRNAHLTIEHN